MSYPKGQVVRLAESLARDRIEHEYRLKGDRYAEPHEYRALLVDPLSAVDGPEYDALIDMAFDRVQAGITPTDKAKVRPFLRLLQDRLPHLPVMFPAKDDLWLQAQMCRLRLTPETVEQVLQTWDELLRTKAYQCWEHHHQLWNFRAGRTH